MMTWPTMTMTNDDDNTNYCDSSNTSISREGEIMTNENNNNNDGDNNDDTTINRVDNVDDDNNADGDDATNDDGKNDSSCEATNDDGNNGDDNNENDFSSSLMTNLNTSLSNAEPKRERGMRGRRIPSMRTRGSNKKQVKEGKL